MTDPEDTVPFPSEPQAPSDPEPQAPSDPEPQVPSDPEPQAPERSAEADRTDAPDAAKTPVPSAPVVAPGLSPEPAPLDDAAPDGPAEHFADAQAGSDDVMPPAAQGVPAAPALDEPATTWGPGIPAAAVEPVPPLEARSAAPRSPEGEQDAPEPVAPTPVSPDEAPLSAASAEAPSFEEPATDGAPTELPSAEAPSPSTEAPTTEAPTTEAPSTEATTTEAPATEATAPESGPADPALGEDGPAPEAAAPALEAAAPADLSPLGDEAEPVDGTEPALSGEPLGGRGVLLGLVGLVVALAVLAGYLVWAVADSRGRGAEEADRRAALAASRDAARVVFSYDYRHLEKDFEAGRALTSGDFRAEYERTTQRVVGDAATRYKAVVLAEVSEAAVVRVDGRTVVALVFLNQQSTSTLAAAPKITQSRVEMTMTSQGGRWLVQGIKAL